MGCGFFFALFVYFVEEVFEFYFLLGGHEGAELFAALLADLFLLGVSRGVERFPRRQDRSSGAPKCRGYMRGDDCMVMAFEKAL